MTEYEKVQRILKINQRIRWFLENRYDIRFSEIRREMVTIRAILGEQDKTLSELEYEVIEDILSKIEAKCHPDDLYMLGDPNRWYKWA